MPQDNFTSKLLDMEAFEIMNVSNTQDSIVVTVRMQRRIVSCPRCNTPTDRVHDYRTQRVKDCPVMGKHFVWLYKKRRYRCVCCGKRFYESNYLLPKGHRITNRTAALCLNMLVTKQSRKDISHSLGVSQSTVQRWLHLKDFSRATKLPNVLSIDEFRGNTEAGKFQCILTAPCKRKIVDILPTRNSSDLSAYFRACDNRHDVRYFIMDMNREYLSIAKAFLPNAKIVIDRFHVVRYVTWALENVRKRVQKTLLPEQRKYFKRSRKLLLAHMDKLSDNSKAAVELMLTYARDLREAYLLKEAFYKFMSAEDSGQAKHLLRAFRLHAFAADIPEFKPCFTMLKNWEPYILNAFDCSYSNGFTEGINNSIKVIKRVAYGYRSFKNFRARILTSIAT